MTEHEHSTPASCSHCNPERRGARYWLEVAAVMTGIILLSYFLPGRGLFAGNLASTENIASLGAVFLIGLVAATSSCLALVGGLLISISAKWTELHQPQTKWQKFQPLFLFNIGRLAGYFVLGGVVGLIGRAFTLSANMSGYLTIVLSVVMIILGLNILRILPKKYCSIPLPAGMWKRIGRLTNTKNPLMPIFLGALTFFVPCGFTQSTQLLALGSGSFITGAIIMLVFALGTLPALLGISAVSALVKGGTARWFVTIAGCVSLFLGMVSLEGGLLLAGYDVRGIVTPRAPVQEHADPFVSTDEQGRQIVSMYVNDDGYRPDHFTIDPNRETWVYAVAKGQVSGCASILSAPTFGLSTPIQPGGNWLGPMKPKKGNSFVVTCSMGMLRATIDVRG